MSLEYALEKFPIHGELDAGLKYEIRPLERSDEGPFQEFHLAIPEPERLFIKNRVTDQSLFHDWCENIDLERNMPLLMLADDRIVGDATLHKREDGWKRHIGLVSLLILPEYRGRGIARTLVGELIDIARHMGLKKIETEILGDWEAAIRALARMGFRELVRLPDYVQDMQCVSHDYVLMGMDLITPEEFAGMG